MEYRLLFPLHEPVFFFVKSLEVVGRYESARCDEGIDKFRL